MNIVNSAGSPGDVGWRQPTSWRSAAGADLIWGVTMRSASLLSVAVGFLALVGAVPAHATSIVFNSEAAFLAAISSPGVDTFNDMPEALVSSPIARNAGAYSYTGAASAGFYPAGSDADRWLSNNTAHDPMVLSGFEAAVRGIGGFFFGTDLAGDFLAGTTIEVTLVDANSSSTISLTDATLSTFLGFVSDSPLVSLTVSAVDASIFPYKWPAINDLTLGQAASPVPEPGTLALVAMGLAGIGMSRLRRRN